MQYNYKLDGFAELVSMPPSWLAEFVLEKMAEESSRGPKAAQWMLEAKGMTLYGTIGHEAVLRPDGSVWFYHAVDWVNDPDTWAWKKATAPEAWGCFLIAAERIPEVAALVPARPHGAANCQACNGSGRHAVGIPCPSCHGLGWDPAEAV